MFQWATVEVNIYMMTSSNGSISVLLVFCERNPPVTGGLHSIRPVTRNFDVFFDLCLNKILMSIQSGTGDLRRHRANYDVTVINPANISVQRVAKGVRASTVTRSSFLMGCCSHSTNAQYLLLHHLSVFLPSQFNVQFRPNRAVAKEVRRHALS